MPQAAFVVLASQNKGCWEHDGSVELPTGEVAINGHIVLKEGDLSIADHSKKQQFSLAVLQCVKNNGTTHVSLDSPFIHKTDVTLKDLKALHLTCAEAIKIQALLQSTEVFFNGQKGFDLGVDNDHFGKVIATAGRLEITVQEDLNAQYGHLYSMKKMVLRSETARVDIGEMVSKGVSYGGRGYTIYDPNGAFVASNGDLDIYAAKGGNNKSLVWVGGDLSVDIPDTSSDHPSFSYENIAGHILVWGDCNLDLQAMYNKRLPITTICPSGTEPYPNPSYQQETSRAAQFHVQGTFKTQAPTFHNIASLVRVVGDFTGDAEKLYTEIQQGGTGTGWHNIKRILYHHSPHHKDSNADGHEILTSLIEPEIAGIFPVGGDFLPPSYLTSFESSGVIESRIARLMIDGPLILTGHGSATQTSARVVPLDTFMPKNGLFQKNVPEDVASKGASPVSQPVVQERFPLGGEFTEAMSRAPRLVIPSRKTRLLLEENKNTPCQIPTFTRDYFSPAALSYTLLTGVVPLLPRSYQHLNPSDLLTALQGNSVKYLKKLSLLKGSDPLYILKGATESVPNNDTLVLRNPDTFLGAPNLTEPMMAFAEEEIDGEIVLMPYIALPPKDNESGVFRTDEEFEADAENIRLTGALIKSLKSYVDLKSKNQIITVPFYERKVTSGGKDTTIIETIPHVSGIEAAKGVRLETSGPQTHVGTKFKAGDKYEIFLKAVHMRLLAAQRTKETITKAKKRTGMKDRHLPVNDTKVKETKTTFESTPVPVEMNAGNVRIITDSDIVDEASHIITKLGIDFESKKGKILLKTALKQFHHAVQRSSESPLWNQYKSEGRSSSTVVEGVKNPGKGKIRMHAPEGGIEYHHRADSLLDDELSKYLETQKNVIRRALNDESDSWCEENHSLGLVVVAAIVIVVTYFTAGAGTGVAASLGTSSMVSASVAAGCGAAVAAGVGAVASQTLISLVNNDGDLGAVAQELTSSESLKSLAISMLSAGITNGALKALDLGGAISGTVGKQVLSRTQAAAIRAGVNTVLKSTIDGRNFGDVLAEEGRAGAASVVGGTLANKAGVAYKDPDVDMNKVVHKIIHGVIGGISGLISGGTEEAFASVIGAVIGEVVAESFESAHHDGVYDPNHPSFDRTEREAMVRKGTMYAELSAAVFAGILGQDPRAAATAAHTAATENAFVPQNPTPARYSQDQVGDVVADVIGNSSATDEIEAVTEMAEALAKKLPGLGLSPEQYQQMAERLVAHAHDANGSIDVEKANSVALQALLEIRGVVPAVKILNEVGAYFDEEADTLSKTLQQDKKETHDAGVKIASFFTDDKDVQEIIGDTAGYFGVAVLSLGGAISKKRGPKVTKTTAAAASKGKGKVGGGASPLLPGEGRVASFSELTKLSKKGDNLAIHHVPNDQYMKTKGVFRSEGVSIMTEQPTPGHGGRHRKIHSTMPRQDPALSARNALAQSIKRSRKVYNEDGFSGEIRPHLQKVIKENKKRFPEIFQKGGEHG